MKEGHYHFHVKIISRGKGQAVTAAAAYRAGEEIHDERLDQTFDYTRKQSIYRSEIIAPENAPDWLQQQNQSKARSRLWNTVEQTEKRKDAQLAREFQVSLPQELTHPQKVELVRGFVEAELTRKGIIADVAYHNFIGRDYHNPHAHLLTTLRHLKGDGFGEKISNWKEWKNEQKTLKHWREAWANHVNRAYEKAGLDIRVEHRSFKDRDVVDRAPVHESMAVNQMRKKAERNPEKYPLPEKAKHTNKIKSLNKEIAAVKAELAREEEKEQRRVQWREAQLEKLAAATEQAVQEKQVKQRQPQQKTPTEGGENQSVIERDRHEEEQKLRNVLENRGQSHSR